VAKMCRPMATANSSAGIAPACYFVASVYVTSPLRLLRQPLHPLSVDRSWRHRIDPNAMARPFDSQMLGQTGGDEFRRTVGRLSCLAGHT
jgi:hypothetical protein